MAKFIVRRFFLLLLTMVLTVLTDLTVAIAMGVVLGLILNQWRKSGPRRMRRR